MDIRFSLEIAVLSGVYHSSIITDDFCIGDLIRIQHEILFTVRSNVHVTFDFNLCCFFVVVFFFFFVGNPRLLLLSESHAHIHSLFHSRLISFRFLLRSPSIYTRSIRNLNCCQSDQELMLFAVVEFVCRLWCGKCLFFPPTNATYKNERKNVCKN